MLVKLTRGRSSARVIGGVTCRSFAIPPLHDQVAGHSARSGLLFVSRLESSFL